MKGNLQNYVLYHLVWLFFSIIYSTTISYSDRADMVQIEKPLPVFWKAKRIRESLHFTAPVSNFSNISFCSSTRAFFLCLLVQADRLKVKTSWPSIQLYSCCGAKHTARHQYLSLNKISSQQALSQRLSKGLSSIHFNMLPPPSNFTECEIHQKDEEK